MNSLFDAAAQCLSVCSIEEKLHLTRKTALAWRQGCLLLSGGNEPQSIGEPGRPEKPLLVPPGNVPKRRLGTRAGLIAMIHAIAHIEFNAINLAWDAVYRFRDLPQQYYSDWIRVAVEEAHHFELLRNRLIELAGDYGDLPAHNGLWEMAVRTAGDPMVRMALVPRVLEARGLDVTPGIINRLRQIGDEKTIAVLEVIMRDEIGHVAMGSFWFNYLCAQRNVDSEQTFAQLIAKYFTGQLNGPFHYAARRQAGFTETELIALACIDASSASTQNGMI